MSAFYDIFIGDKPTYFRLENNAWMSDHNPGNYWVSKPVIEKALFFDEVSDETHRLLILGQFYEPFSKKELLKQCADYCDGTNQNFVDPAGHYIFFLFDKRNKHWHVFTNRFGTYHAYYSTVPRSIGTYYIGMAKQANEKKLDWHGITGFFETGYFPGETTYLENIKIFDPASHYHFDGELNLLSKKRYWNWKYDTSKYTTDSIDLFHDTLSSSLHCALEGKKVALPISGGLDSRTLAGVLSGINNRNDSLWSFSYGFSEKSKEISIAGQIANVSGFKFEQHIVPDYLFEKKELITDSVELFQYIDGTRQACMKEKLETYADVVVGGHWGDVWMDDMKMPVENNEESIKAAFSKKIIKKGSQWLVSNVSGNHAKNTSVAYPYFKEFTDRYNYIKDADFLMKIYKTDQWSFRWTMASIRMYQSAVFPVLPFYDKRVVDILLTIPSGILKDRKFQVEYIKKYFPKLAKIKWQEYNSNLYNYKWLNNRNLLYRGVNKIKRTLSPEKQIIRNADIFYLNNSGKEQLYTSLLGNKELGNIVSCKKIEELLQSYYNNPSAANTYAVSMLHTFAQFIHKLNG